MIIPDSHSCSDQNCDDRLPTLIAMILKQIIHKCFLLRDRQGTTLLLHPYMALLDLAKHPCCRIDSDEAVSHCHLECRMKLCMNIINCCRGISFLGQQLIIELLHIRIPNIHEPALSKGLPYEMIIRVNVVYLCRRLKIELLLDIR